MSTYVSRETLITFQKNFHIISRHKKGAILGIEMINISALTNSMPNFKNKHIDQILLFISKNPFLVE